MGLLPPAATEHPKENCSKHPFRYSRRDTMRIPLVSVGAVTILLALVPCFVQWLPPPPTTSPIGAAEATNMLGRLPVAFVPNMGQWSHPARYVASVGNITVFLDERGWIFTLIGHNSQDGDNNPQSEDTKCGVAVRMVLCGSSTSE